MIKPGQMVKEYLMGERIDKISFDDLVIVAEELINERSDKVNRVLDWFRYLQKKEITGWRNKANTKKIARILFNSLDRTPGTFYALFCPSYKKGDGAFGVRTDDVGNTTVSGLANLDLWYAKTKSIGIPLNRPKAIFFDIALEQAEKIIENDKLSDLEININNFRSRVPKSIDFVKLSDLMPDVLDVVGYSGVIFEPLPIPKEVYERIVERGKKFYTLFGWSDDQIHNRSRIIASSESYVGSRLRQILPNGIMLYTPTMLERAQVYSGFEYNNNPLPIIFPTKMGS